jgi:uncharacterized caspase-like protein
MGTISAPRHALVYGVSTYVSSLAEGEPVTIGGQAYTANLSYSDDDAASLADVLVSQGWTSVTRRIKGSAGSTAQLPSRTQIAADIAALSTIAANATVLVYFSGHGTTDSSGRSYIVPYGGIADSSLVRPSVDYAGCISASDLGGMIAGLPTRNVIVVIDTCFSGGFVDPGSSIDTAPQDYSAANGTRLLPLTEAITSFGSLLSANAAERGAASPIVLAAAGSQELSWEADSPPYGGHGVFTHFLLESAANGDSNGDGFVSTSEAYSYSLSGIESAWNSEPYNQYSMQLFLPHISGGVRDLVLFGR